MKNDNHTNFNVSDKLIKLNINYIIISYIIITLINIKLRILTLTRTMLFEFILTCFSF